jgi:prepilin-type N-terminal cleavage/methylation domain-containing protein
MRTRAQRRRGFTLVEIMVALMLSAVVAAGILELVHSQLAAFELNDSIMRTQQNARAGLAFAETQLRRACRGVSDGRLGVNVPGLTPVQRNCVQFYDGASACRARRW